MDIPRPKILIVDDTPANLQVMRRILKNINAELFEASGGFEALELILKHDFALALLDVQMPEMSGYEIAESMQALKRTKDIPIIFVTANAAEEMALLKGYESGGVDYLTKPFNKNVLISKVNIFLELYTALNEAREANHIKTRFLANMSHEIRTPLNGIIGMTELLMPTELTEKQNKYVNTIHGSGDVLLTLINDILNFSKIEAGEIELNPAPVDLYEEIKQLMEILIPRSVENNNEFALYYDEDIPDITADITRIKQVIINLAGNALKFTKDAYVTLSVKQESTSDEKTTLLFEIKDGGIGIPEDKLENIFERFVQADISTTKEYGGTGLGLAICQSLVEIMGGEIGVDSKVGVGSTFWFRISFPVCEPIHPELKRPSPEGILSKRVLIIDDFEENCDILSSFLSNWHIENKAFTSAQKGLAALEIAHVEGKPYDVVLCDYTMPEMNGAEFATSMRADEKHNDTKLIMVTGIHKIGDTKNAQGMGFTSCLLKPVYPSELLKALIAAFQTPEDGQAHSEIPSITADAAPDKFTANILLVEDARINQMMAEEMLMDMGCTVDIADNGKIGVENFKNNRYDLILMDCQMPEMDGYEATGTIRSLGDTYNTAIPIIAMTANAMDGDREKCLAAGMDDYISKPAKTAVIHKMLSQYLKAA